MIENFLFPAMELQLDEELPPMPTVIVMAYIDSSRFKGWKPIFTMNENEYRQTPELDLKAKINRKCKAARFAKILITKNQNHEEKNPVG
jgi:hypothetical protein